MSETSLIRQNAEADPGYAPYCLSCTTMARMRQVKRFYWRCVRCGADHDERRPTDSPVLALLQRERQQE